MHAEDWWGMYYMEDKESLKAGTARHQKKYSQLEDAYNARWQTIVNAGHLMTADESRAAGWYQSMVRIGPVEPKPAIGAQLVLTLCWLEAIC